MKREADPYQGVRPIFAPFAWRLCANCRKEFRREKGWCDIDPGPYFGVFGFMRYLCGTCAPDKATAGELFKKKPWLPPLKPPRA